MVTQKQKEGDYYYEAIGRRKTAHARVRMREAVKRGGAKGGQRHDPDIVINKQSISEYFPVKELQQIVAQPLVKLGLSGIKVEILVMGGGMRGQAEAIRHGLARALVKKDAALKPMLKVHGFLTRDARVKERRKFGLKKARRAPQWAKR